MGRTIPLTEAGYRLGLSYSQILRRVMVGELRGNVLESFLGPFLPPKSPQVMIPHLG